VEPTANTPFGTRGIVVNHNTETLNGRACTLKKASTHHRMVDIDGIKRNDGRPFFLLRFSNLRVGFDGLKTARLGTISEE